jgi:hypothetical protein
MAGYAGVMMGMRWRESLMLLLPSHTWKPRFSFSMGFSRTGVGQRQVLKICSSNGSVTRLAHNQSCTCLCSFLCTAHVCSCDCPRGSSDCASTHCVAHVPHTMMCYADCCTTECAIGAVRVCCMGEQTHLEEACQC